MTIYSTPAEIIFASVDPGKEVLLRQEINVFLNKHTPANPVLPKKTKSPAVKTKTLVRTTDAISPPDQTTAVQDMKDSSQGLYGDSVNIQIYTTTILQQPIIKLDLDDKSIDLPAIQTTAKAHATNWTGTYFPKIAQSQADIADICNNFAAFYKPLIGFANAIGDSAQKANLNSNVTNFKQGLFLLQGLVDGKSDNINAAIAALTEFTGEVSGDNNSFQAVQNKANQEYQGSTGEIAQLQKEISDSNSAITKLNAEIAGSACGLVLSGLFVAVGVTGAIFTGGASLAIAGMGVSGAVAASAVLAVKVAALKNEQKNNASLVSQLVTINASLAGIKNVVDVFTNFVSKSQDAITSLTNMSTHWGNLSAYYNNLEGSCDSLAAQDPVVLGAFLVAMLNSLQENFADLKSAAQYCVDNASLDVTPAVDPSINSNIVMLASPGIKLASPSVHAIKLAINPTIDAELATLKQNMNTTDPILTSQINTACQALQSASPPTADVMINTVAGFQTMVKPLQDESVTLASDLDQQRLASIAQQQDLLAQQQQVQNDITTAQQSLQNAQNDYNQQQNLLSTLYGNPLLQTLIPGVMDAIRQLAGVLGTLTGKMQQFQSQILSSAANLQNLKNESQDITNQITIVQSLIQMVTNVQQNMSGLTATLGNVLGNLQQSGAGSTAWAAPWLQTALGNWRDAINNINGNVPSQLSAFSLASPKVFALTSSATTTDSDVLQQPLQNLTDASSALYVSSLQVQLYAQTVLMQANIDLAINGIDIAAYQTIARKHALIWFSTYHPAVLQMQANIAAFCNHYTSLFPVILQIAADLSLDDNIKSFQQGISLLIADLDNYVADDAIILQQLNVYSKNLHEDYWDFTTAEMLAENQYTAQGGELDQLRSQLKDINGQISAANDQVAWAAVSEAATVVGIIGTILTLPESAPAGTAFLLCSGALSFAGSTAALDTAVESLSDLRKQANQIQQNIAKDSKDLAVLTGLTAQFRSFIKTTGSDPIESATALNKALYELCNTLKALNSNYAIYTAQELRDSLTNANISVAALKKIAQQCVGDCSLSARTQQAAPPAQELTTSFDYSSLGNRVAFFAADNPMRRPSNTPTIDAGRGASGNENEDMTNKSVNVGCRCS
jgi:Bacillus haemolytic enterotoxin (HBL)